MKTKIAKILFVAVALIGFALAPLVADSATVVSVEGKVEVNRNGAWQALSEKSRIAEGEIISTGFKSKALIQYQGAVLQLGPLTRVTLEKLAQGEKSDTMSVYLNTGAVRSTVRHTENKRVSYTVRNPVAVASVRGTIYDMTSNGSVYCSEGATVVYPAALYVAPETPTVSTVNTNGTAVSGAMGIAEIPASGTSSAVTPATDIAPSAPNGSQVVLPGQNVDFAVSGALSTPQKNAANTATHVLNTLNTPVDNERVQTGIAQGDMRAGSGRSGEITNTCTIIVHIVTPSSSDSASGTVSGG
ncbi:MAG: FecR domain-containing protein [Treponema sp.]|nr:FecR domain-containing protein [Treponema sp.]